MHSKFPQTHYKKSRVITAPLSWVLGGAHNFFFVFFFFKFPPKESKTKFSYVIKKTLNYYFFSLKCFSYSNLVASVLFDLC